MDQDAKRKALDEALKQIEKDFGKGAVMKLGDPSNTMNMGAMPTGSLSLDLVPGLGGILKGRIIEVHDPESSGKTMVALRMAAGVQKRGGITGFIGAEHVLDPVYAENIGAGVDNLYISQPDTGEQALEITETMVRNGAADIIIVDSIAALVPKAKIEGDMDDLHVGLQACLMSQALCKLTSIASNANSMVVSTNQLREEIGTVLGSPGVTTGGRALKSYSSVHLDARKIDVLKQGGEIVGACARVKVVKSKIALPSKETELNIMPDKGISKEGDILDLVVKENTVEKSGAWFSYESNKVGQSRENAKSSLHEHPALAAEIENRVHEVHGLAPVETEMLPKGAEFTLPLTGEWDAE